MMLLAVLLAAAPTDLAALAQQQAWAELLEKAEAVAPAERDDRWRAHVGSAATAVTQAAKTTKEPFGPAEKADALAARFTFLSARAPSSISASVICP